MGELPRLFLYILITYRSDPQQKGFKPRNDFKLFFFFFLLLAGNEPLTTCEIDNFKPSAYTQPNGGEIVV